MSDISWHRRVEYACGYIELGMLQDAASELDSLQGDDRLRPEVLAVQCDLFSEAKDWPRMIEAGRNLARCSPASAHGWISWAFALREVQKIAEAREVLLEAETHHPACGNLHYNLACYYCLLGDVAEAARRLRCSIEMDRKWKESALDDPDLQSMRDHIEAL